MYMCVTYTTVTMYHAVSLAVLLNHVQLRNACCRCTHKHSWTSCRITATTNGTKTALAKAQGLDTKTLNAHRGGPTEGEFL